MGHLITHSNNELLLDNFCPQCGKSVLASDNFCRHCGRACHDLVLSEANLHRALLSVQSQREVVAVADPVATLMNNRLLVIGLIAMTGPLGLPALWFSQRFSKSTKVVTTVVYMLLTTIVPLAIAWYWLESSLRPLVEAFPR